MLLEPIRRPCRRRAFHPSAHKSDPTYALDSGGFL